MRNRPLIHMDSELGKRLGLTSESFNSGFVYDLRPTRLCVMNLFTKDGKEEQCEEFFQKALQVVTPIRIVSPEPIIGEMALKKGWIKANQPEGTVYYDNKG